MDSTQQHNNKVSLPDWDTCYAERSPVLCQLPVVVSVLDNFPDLAQYNQMRPRGMCNAQGMPIAFVPQGELRGNYEIHIYETGGVPTRADNWHDFFNAHVWCNFPVTKAVLNALQYEQLTMPHRVQRTALENALTLFDENGAIVLSTNPELLRLLSEHDWETLFLERRQSVLDELQVVVFGHSLHEKALTPYIGMTSHCLMQQVDALLPIEADGSFERSALAAMDAVLAKRLETIKTEFTTRQLQPLPILGYPGWYAGLQDYKFYSNKDYFRQKRHFT